MNNKILLIDDESEILSTIAAALEVDGDCEVHMAQNIYEAKQKMINHDFHLIVSDIQLPDGLGTDLMKSKWTKNAEILFMTGNQDREFLKDAIKVGACGFVDKPFNVKQIKLAIYRALCIQEESSSPENLRLMRRGI